MRAIFLCVAAYTIKGTTETRQIRLAAGKTYRKSIRLPVSVHVRVGQKVLPDLDSVNSRGERYESFLVAVSLC